MRHPGNFFPAQQPPLGFSGFPPQWGNPGGDMRFSAPSSPSHHSHYGSSAASSAGTFLSRASLESGKPQSVRVVVRIRPPNERDGPPGKAQGIMCQDDRTVHIIAPNVDNRAMTFDQIFDQTTSQERVFEACGVKNLILQALDGYATTVFAYGQTGSGKSHTMTGPQGAEFDNDGSGIILRSLQYLFETKGHVETSTSSIFTLRASYLEIYNEHVHDLLNSTDSASLAVRWTAERNFYVENLLVLDCQTMQDCVTVVQEGVRNRTTRAHELNEYSSRSHSMMTIHIDIEGPDPYGGKPVRKHGKISFVDLAGSEKIADSKASGKGLNESLNINKSLLMLGNCISALSDPRRRAGHIPYRDSNLTRLLADSLGGTGLALMIACISPSSRHIHETVKTLRYAQRAKRIRARPVIHIDPRDEVVDSLKKEISQLRLENQYLKDVIGQREGIPSSLGSGLHLPAIGLGPISLTTFPEMSTHWGPPTPIAGLPSSVPSPQIGAPDSAHCAAGGNLNHPIEKPKPPTGKRPVKGKGSQHRIGPKVGSSSTLHQDMSISTREQRMPDMHHAPGGYPYQLPYVPHPQQTFLPGANYMYPSQIWPPNTQNFSA